MPTSFRFFRKFTRMDLRGRFPRTPQIIAFGTALFQGLIATAVMLAWLATILGIVVILFHIF